MSNSYSSHHNSGPTKPAGKIFFTGRKILLVEDNPFNARLAIAILELFGCAVIAADGGEKAIERLRQESGIDLVLMDCQMPEMDGFEATRFVRELQQRNEIPKMPIIALTANAMKGDHERCLEVGMDDYLTKPLRKDVLGQMLVKWLANEKPPAVADNGWPIANEDARLADAPCLDQQILDDIRALMGSKFENVVQLYIEDTDDRIRAIEQTLAVSGDAKNIALQAHSIKSSSAHMGAARLAVVAGTMETSARDAIDHHKDADGLAPLLEEIRTIFAETQRNFSQLDENRASG